jgi:hypothetical protein
MQLLTPFLSGEEVPASGQYWVIHLQHRLPHKAILTAGERFPACKQCDTNILYEYASALLIDGGNLTEDRDFATKKPSIWTL